MKKFIVLIVAVFITMTAVFALTGCDAKSTLSINKKYILRTDVKKPEEEQTYLIFRFGGKGQYHYYSKDSGTVTKYTIYFKYTFLNDRVYCFYDSIEYAPEHTENEPEKNEWSPSLYYSRDILIAYSGPGAAYLNEDFIPKIANHLKLDD